MTDRNPTLAMMKMVDRHGVHRDLRAKATLEPTGAGTIRGPCGRRNGVLPGHQGRRQPGYEVLEVLCRRLTSHENLRTHYRGEARRQARQICARDQSQGDYRVRGMSARGGSALCHSGGECAVLRNRGLPAQTGMALT